MHWFRDVHGVYPVTPEGLKKRTDETRSWVDAYARNHNIPVERAQKGVKKEDYVQPYLKRMARASTPGRPSIPPMIQTTGSSGVNDGCTGTSTSTSGMKWWGRW